MATTGELSGFNAAGPVASRAPIVVGFDAPRLALPIRPGIALRWALIALVVANLGRIPLLSTGGRDAALVVNDIVVSAVVAFAAVAAVLRRSLRLDSVAILAVLFALVGLGSALLAMPRFGLTPFEVAISLTYLVRWLVYFGIYLFVINNVRLDQVSSIWQSLEWTILAITVFGIFQAIFLPGFAQMVYPDSRDGIDWDVQGHRLVSTVLEPNIVAAMIVLVLLVQLAQISTSAPVPWWKPVVLLAGLAATVSRSGVLALLVGIVIIVMARGISLRLVRLFAVISFVLVALIPKLIQFASAYGKFSVGEGSSASTRLISWLLAIQTISDNPVIGVGFNTYGYVKARAGLDVAGAAAYSSDGGLLFVAVITGVVGVLIYLLMYRAIIRRCRMIWRNERISAEHRGLAIGVAAGIFAVTVHSLFVNSMFTTFVMEIIWVTWGFTFVIARDWHASTDSVPSR